jgi:hypothetical protein
MSVGRADCARQPQPALCESVEVANVRCGREPV